jgi:flagellin-like hook-associated protein FlgL
LQDAAQVISGLQTTTGASVEQLQAALQNAESTAAQTTASAATVSSADLPQVTVALARQQWLAQSGLQVLTQARTLQQRTAQTLATIVS